ncbi:hypothetical protein NXZ75_10935 [Lysinibacillus sphaericus]|uniref:hypothetical protein n=1 Tax=Lysinibacillus sphaericus TaxID=1421 RepID=UPI002162EF26|nr:hypothetical protein [Lysinibacillus sphaericus]MCS1382707.1 hypothetical protein [Lysinibacillus sphaericus]
MIPSKKVNDLIERLINDAADRKGSNQGSYGLYQYLEDALNNANFTNDAAIGSIKQALKQGISSLSGKQLKAIALDMLNNEIYMEKCPNGYCGETIAWEDMSTALWEGQCCHCCNVQDKWKRA